jgi:hypothetical protein
VGKQAGKIPQGRPRYRSEDKIKIDVRETGWDDTDWIDRAQGREGPVAGSCEHCSELSGPIKCWEFVEQPCNLRLPKKDSAPWSWLVGWLVGWLAASTCRSTWNLLRLGNDTICTPSQGNTCISP